MNANRYLRSYELAVWNRLHFSGKKVLLHVGKCQNSNQKIPDAELRFRRQRIPFMQGLEAE